MNDRDFADALVWIANSPVLSIDTETSGLFAHEWDEVMGISVANQFNQMYFPLRHPGSQNLTYDQAHKLILLLSQPRERIIFHNAIFDWPMLRKEGWTYPRPWQTTWDTMVAAWLIDENMPKKLEEQVAIFLYSDRGYGYAAKRAQEQRARQKRIKKIGWANATASEIQEYGAFDARHTYDLYLVQRERFSQDASLAVAFVREMRFLQVCDEMISNGVRIDAEQAMKKLHECDIGIAMLEDEYPGLNFDSPKQIGELLFSDDGWGLIASSFTSKGQPSTDKDTLLNFLEFEPRINDIFNYRKLRKARSTYYAPMVERVGRDGRIHAWYRPHGTKTGRMSCLVEDSLVRTSRGETRVQDVRPGDVVYTHKNRWRSVLRQWKVGIEPVFDVVLTNGETVTCTSSHRLLTLDGWKSVEEMMNEHQQEVGVGSQEPAASARPVPRFSFVVAGHGGAGAWYDSAQRESCADDLYAEGRTGRSSERQEVGLEAWSSQPDEGEEGREASQLEGSMRGWVRLPHLSSPGQASLRTPPRYGKVLGLELSSEKVRRSSHRRGQDEQRVGQPRPRHEERAQDYPLLAGEGQRVVGIKEIVARGSRTVYDLTVEEDESYMSGGVFSHNCSEPNLQTLPHEDTLPGIKDCFIPADGYSLMEYDLSQAELRVAAFYADDDVLRQHLAEGDVHAGTARAMFGSDDPISRSVAKNLNFGALYGIGAKKFVKTARRKGDMTTTEDIARQHLGMWRNLYHGVSKAFDDAQEIATQRGYVKLWPEGRTRTFASAHCFDNPKDAFNSIVQGGVGEYVKQLMMDLRESALSLGVKLVGNVHDSLLFEVPNDSRMEERWTAIVRQTAALSNPFVPMSMPIGAKKWTSTSI